jgi:hypothetical protein
MPSWLTEVLKLLGFTTPFVYAAATYGLFHYLDKKASGPAKQAIVSWLKPRPLNHAQLSATMLELFDKLYRVPLLSLRSLRRSALLTFILTVIFVAGFVIHEAVYSDLSPLLHPQIIAGELQILAVGLLANVLSDYCSLFAVRWFLIRGSSRPWVLSIVSAFIGILIVYSFAVLRFLISSPIVDMHDTLSRIPTAPLTAEQVEGMYFRIHFMTLSSWFLIPALLVHLWMPLFSLGAAVLRLVNGLLVATAWAQWFLKGGKHHPLEAIGYVAALVVLVIGIIFQLVWR